MGNVIFFNGTDGSGRTLSEDLWVSDGTADGTFAVGGAKNAGAAGTDGGLSPSDITPFAGGVLFNGVSGLPGQLRDRAAFGFPMAQPQEPMRSRERTFPVSPAAI